MSDPFYPSYLEAYLEKKNSEKEQNLDPEDIPEETDELTHWDKEDLEDAAGEADMDAEREADLWN